MDSLFKGIYTEFTGSALATQIGNRLYLNEAPQGVQFPYAVYHLITGITDWEFCPTAGDWNLDEVMIQFDLFSDNLRELSEINTMYANLKTCYDWALLTMPGGSAYTHLYMRREFFNLVRNIDEAWWQYVVQYRLMFES